MTVAAWCAVCRNRLIRIIENDDDEDAFYCVSCITTTQAFCPTPSTQHLSFGTNKVCIMVPIKLTKKDFLANSVSSEIGFLIIFLE